MKVIYGQPFWIFFLTILITFFLRINSLQRRPRGHFAGAEERTVPEGGRGPAKPAASYRQQSALANHGGVRVLIGRLQSLEIGCKIRRRKKNYKIVI